MKHQTIEEHIKDDDKGRVKQIELFWNDTSLHVIRTFIGCDPERREQGDEYLVQRPAMKLKMNFEIATALMCYMQSELRGEKFQKLYPNMYLRIVRLARDQLIENVKMLS